MISCISTKGKLLWQQKMPAGILTIQPLDIASRGGQFIAVSLSNRKVLIFEDKHVVDWVCNQVFFSSFRCFKTIALGYIFGVVILKNIF